MTPEQLLNILQLNDSLFPTGGFAYSDGLETAVSRGAVSDAKRLEEWMRQYIESVFVPCDGLAVFRSMIAYQKDDWSALRNIDEQLTALKPAASIRAGNRSMGKSFLKSVMGIHPHSGLDRATQELANLPVIYGVVASILGFATKDALLSFAYIRLASSASASLRLMSIGQQQAQSVLHRVLEIVPGAAERVIANSQEELRSFAPLMDIQQMNHRYVYSRLFRS